MELTRDVEAPAGKVWEIVTDLTRAPERIRGIESVEILRGEEFSVGTRWRETRKMFGREATEEMEITAVDPGRSYRAEADSHGAHYTSEVIVRDLGDDRSELTMTFDAEPGGTVSRILAATIGKLFEGPTRKALLEDLNDIAEAAEAEALRSTA